jgi:hypothetical protein
LVPDPEFNDNAFQHVGNKLETAKGQIFFIPVVMVTIAYRVVYKIFCVIQAKRIIIARNGNAGCKAIHKFNRMIPDATHLSLDMPAELRK